MMRSEQDREAPLDADAPQPDPTTVRVRPRSGDPRVTAAIGVVAVLVGLAVLKPWGAGSADATRDPIALRPTTIPTTPEPTEDRSADGLASAVCLGAGAWQVASLEGWRTQDVRVWRAIAPIAGARGPDDPAIPSVPIVALEVEALGWCAPAYEPNRPTGPAVVSAWYVRDGLVTELQVRQVRPADGETPLGALYVPLTSCPEVTICVPLLEVPVPGRWVSGRVVFRYTDAGSDTSVWLAAEIEIVPPAEDPATGPTSQPS